MKNKRVNSNLFLDHILKELEYAEPIYPMSVFKLGITDIQFEFKNDKTIMIVTLERPGFLIGKGGSTIDGLTAWLSNEDMPVEIKIVESKLWSNT